MISVVFIDGVIYQYVLFSFTKPTKCTYNIHNNIVLYHSNMCHQVLKLSQVL